jgi:pimeloyl-ACP methyl ester carboxylesterase
MSPRRRFGKKLFKSFLPIVLVLALAVLISVGYIIYGVTRPPRQPYLVTPENYRLISGVVLKVSDETWRNHDGTQARGWLLRGAEGAPAVVLLHRYGTDRSWLFNLGVKLNETTRFTILWPDLRGHGVDPLVKWTSFGGREAQDVQSAIDFLRATKGEAGRKLIGDSVGIYGLELGAYAGLRAASSDPQIRVLVLDSVPRSPDDLLHTAVKSDVGLDNKFLQYLVRTTTRVYFLGTFDNTSSCEAAAMLKDRRVLLLSGPEAGDLRESTTSLARCFPTPAFLEVKTDLPLTGFNLTSATGEEGEVYDRRVIEFFDRNLR